MAKQPTAEEVREALDYDPETGAFKWRRRIDVPEGWNTQFAGKRAGSINNNGHLIIAINKRDFPASYLAWMWVTGLWPLAKIDHINNDKLDHRLANLRPATKAQLQWKTGPSLGNRSGMKGVHFHRGDNTYRAAIKVNGNRIHLGRFKTAEEAGEAYRLAAEKLHGEFAYSGT